MVAGAVVPPLFWGGLLLLLGLFCFVRARDYIDLWVWFNSHPGWLLRLVAFAA